MSDLSRSKVDRFCISTKKMSTPTVAPPTGTPKMNALFNSSYNILIGYYGGVDFLDNQEEFDPTFGKDPVLLHTNPVLHESMSNSKHLLDFSYQCHLDLYLHRGFYVGNAKVDKNTGMVEVLCEISLLR